MKHTCGKVMVLRYSDLLKSERNNKALKELRDDVLATELRLSQLRGEEKEIDVRVGTESLPAAVRPPFLVSRPYLHILSRLERMMSYYNMNYRQRILAVTEESTRSS